MITFKQKGDFSKTTKFLEKNQKIKIEELDRYGMMGVLALSKATPVDTGVTADSWDYHIEEGNGRIKIVFTNSNRNDGVPIAIILQYGHATGTGGYVEGIDYINPAVRPIFDKLVEKVWKEVSS
jgi:hypothetical protein